MKYIDADKLIAEIERLQKRAKHYEEVSLTDGERSYWSGEDGALILLTTFITSLQQERPDNEDIDKVAQELYEHLYELKRRNNIPTNLYYKKEIIDLWKAGVEYGRNHPKQEQPEVDLSEETIIKQFDIIDDRCFNEGIVGWKKDKLIARHFYELGLNARKEENNGKDNTAL